MVRSKSPHQEARPHGLFTMMFLGLIIGVIGGYGAIFFRALVAFFHNLFFYGTFSFALDADLHSLVSVWGLGFFFVPVIGAILVSWLIATFSKEAKGHGVPEVIDAIYHKQGVIPSTVIIFKSLASAICIGSGGSVGREGPIIQIGSALGSTIGQIVRMPPRQRIILIAAGAGAGIAATFNAPIGGIAFAVELLLVSTNASTLSVVAIATITAAFIGRHYLGMTPAIDIPELAELDSTAVNIHELLMFIPLGVIIGLASTLFIHAIYLIEDFFDKLTTNAMLRHMLGMSLVSIILLTFMHFTGHYYVEGVGYATIVDVLVGLLAHPGFLLLLFFAKLISTGLTIGSGGSGGIFSPALFLGATLGGAFGQTMLLLLPHQSINPIMFAVAGMAGMVSGATGAVLTAIIMLFEMTRDYNAILPVMLTVTLAYIIRVKLSHESIYTLRLSRRGHEVPDGLEAGLKSSQRALHLMRSDFEIIDFERMEEEQDKIRHCQENEIPVVIAHREHILGLLKPGSTDFKDHLSVITDYILTRPQQGFLALLREMRKECSHTAFVFTNPKADRADQLLGVITAKEIALQAGRSAELMNESI